MYTDFTGKGDKWKLWLNICYFWDNFMDFLKLKSF